MPYHYSQNLQNIKFFCSEEKRSSTKSDMREKIREINKQQLKDEIDFDLHKNSSNDFGTQSESTRKILLAAGFQRFFKYGKYFVLFFGLGYLQFFGLDYRENPLKNSKELTFIKKNEEKTISDMFVYQIAEEFSKNIINWDKEEKNIKFLEENFLESFELAANKYSPVSDLNLVVLDTNVPILQLLSNDHLMISRNVLEDCLIDTSLMNALARLETCNYMNNVGLFSTSFSKQFEYKRIANAFEKNKKSGGLLNLKSKVVIENIFGIKYTKSHLNKLLGMINKVDTEGKSIVEFETLKIYFKEQESKREEVFRQNEDNKYLYKFANSSSLIFF